jgi:hypothetical protein
LIASLRRDSVRTVLLAAQQQHTAVRDEPRLSGGDADSGEQPLFGRHRVASRRLGEYVGWRIHARRDECDELSVNRRLR